MSICSRISKIRAGRVVCALISALVLSSAALAQPAASRSPVADFFSKITGEWIGTCEQSTDGTKSDSKYFRAVIKQIAPGSYDARFDYFRLEPDTGKLLSIGSSKCVTTIRADGAAENKITGEGIIRVNNDPKNQTHELLEVLEAAPNGGIKATGSGKLSVSGMPLGLGKNGQVRSDTSTWSLDDGVLTIDQKLDVKFRAFIFSKSFDVAARYTATRGTDVASLVRKPEKVASVPAGSAAGSD